MDRLVDILLSFILFRSSRRFLFLKVGKSVERQMWIVFVGFIWFYISVSKRVRAVSTDSGLYR